MSARNACSIRQGGRERLWHIPRTKWPMVMIHCVRELARFVGCQFVPPRKRSGSKINLFQDVLSTSNKINEGDVHAYEFR